MPAVDQIRPQSAAPAVEDPISIPLYVGGLIVTLSGVLTVATANATTGSTAIQSVAVLLTLLGFAFSLACRHLKVQSRLLESGFFLFLLYIVVRVFMHDASLEWFVIGADRPETKLAAVLMWLIVLRSWLLVSDDLVMFSCVLSAAMIGLIGTQDVNTITVVYFSLFVLAMTFLLIHQNYLQHRRLAAPRERQRGGPVLPIQLGLALLCGLVVLIVGMALIAPAQMLFANVSLASAIRGLVGANHVADLATPGTGQHFSDDQTLDIGKGSTWPTTSEVLLHVTTSDGAPHYWRGRTYDQYDGTGWTSTQTAMINAVQTAQSPNGTLYGLPIDLMFGEGRATAHALPRRPMIASFEVRGDTTEFYYADEPHTILVGNDVGTAPRCSMDGRLDLDNHSIRSIYTVTSLPPPDLSVPGVMEHLRRDGTDYPDTIRRLYLAPILDDDNTTTNPGDLRACRQILAEALAGLPPGRRTPFDKAQAIQAWISRSCTYSLDVQAIPTDVDHVRYFLTVSRRGYCDLFASSMVVLCRLAGIPARVATGFAPGDRDDTGFNVRALDKHAWAEVYFPNDHWQIFDATIGTQVDGSVPTPRNSSNGFWSRVWTALTTSGPVTKILAGAVLVSLLYLGKTEIYDRRRPGPIRPKANSAEQVEQGYGLLIKSLARLGLPRHPWETPGEYARRIAPPLATQEAALGVPLPFAVVQAATERFAAVRYGRDGGDAGEALDRELREFASAAARARRIQAWRRFLHLKPPFTGGKP